MLTNMLIQVLGVATALLVITKAGVGITVDNFYTALVVAVLWGLLGLTLRPILHLLTLPINILTLGLFSFVVNALLFWLLASFVEGFAVTGFVAALIGSALLAAVSWALQRAL